MSTFVGASTNRAGNATSIAVALPAGVAEGDLLVAVGTRGNAGGTQTIGPPSGWNRHTERTLSGSRAVIFTRRATASEPTSYTFSNPTGDNISIGLGAYRGASRVLAANDLVLEDSASPSGPALAAVVGNKRVLVWAAANSGDAYSTPTGVTERIDSLGVAVQDIDVAADATAGFNVSSSFSLIHSGTQVVLQDNRAPSAPGAFTSPTAGEVVNTTDLVEHGGSTDADGDPLVYDFDLSLDGGTTWSAKRTKAAGVSFTYDYTNEASTTTARWRSRAWDGLVYGPYTESPTFTVQHNVAPSAPTLVAPPNGSVVDLAAGYTFRILPNDPDAGDSTVAYAKRRKVEGAAAYEWWNAGLAAWQSTEVFNTVTAVPAGDELTITYGSGKWVNDTTYNWSARTRDAQGVDGPYATDATVTANVPPTVDVLAPAGTVTTTSRPVITWSYADPENNPQDAYEAAVFTADQYGAAGFDPATSTAVWRSGTVLSATARDTQVGVELDQAVQYRVFVRARQGLGQVFSAWASELFTISLDPPATPLITPVGDAAAGTVAVTVQGRDNVLDDNTGRLTTDAAGWQDAGGAPTRARDTTLAAPHGSQALSYTGTAAGDRRVRTAATFPAAADEAWSASVYFRMPALVSRETSVRLAFLDVAGALLRTVAGARVTATDAGWANATVTGTAPAGTARVRLVAVTHASAADELSYLSAATLHPGGPALVWTRSGLAGVTVARVEFSDDEQATWALLRGMDAVPLGTAQRAVITDREAPPGRCRLYRARVLADV